MSERERKAEKKWKIEVIFLARRKNAGYNPRATMLKGNSK